MSAKLLLIVNPTAGKLTFKNSFYDVVKIFSDGGFDVTVHFTTKKDDAMHTVMEIGKNFDRIVCCGGDGTFNETMNGCLKSGLQMPAIGYIACGSTNDFACSLGIDKSPVLLASDIIKNQNVSLDAGVFNDRYFSYVASFGAFTSVSYDTPQGLKNVLGHLAYILNGAFQLTKIPRIHMKVRCDDYEEEGTYIFGGVTNTTTVGGAYSLPEEDVTLDDGYLELLMVRLPKNSQEISQTLINLAVRNFDDKNLLFMHGKEFVFESMEPVAFTVDGEYGGAGKINTIRCLQKAIRVNGNPNR